MEIKNPEELERKIGVKINELIRESNSKEITVRQKERIEQEIAELHRKVQFLRGLKK